MLYGLACIHVSFKLYYVMKTKVEVASINRILVLLKTSNKNCSFDWSLVLFAPLRTA